MSNILPLLQTEQSKSISDLVNPFSKNNVDKIEFEIAFRPSVFRNDRNCSATIRFINGKTSGNHYMYGDSLDDLITQIKTVLSELK